MHQILIKLVCSGVKDENVDKVYQSAVLANYNPTTVKACADSVLADVDRLKASIKTRLEWSDLELMRAVIVFLDTKSWGISQTGDSMERREETDNLEEIQN